MKFDFVEEGAGTGTIKKKKFNIFFYFTRFLSFSRFLSFTRFIAFILT